MGKEIPPTEKRPKDLNTQRVSRWYFGGLASAAAACITHPLDLLKVLLQTTQDKNASLVKMTTKLVKTEGFFALYNGLTASLVRQLTYSTMRFAIYEVLRNSLMKPGQSAADVSLIKRMGIAAFAGACGGFIGTPTDVVNVRMQNDMRIPMNERRNYKHVVDGLVHVYREGGTQRLFAGGAIASSRAALMTLGQLSFYDQFKAMLLQTSMFEDNLTTHFTASLMAGAVATVVTQPFDVVKTRRMNAKPGEFKNVMEIILITAKSGPLGFFKGFVPAFVRLGPQTILVFVFLEQLRINFGYIKN